MAAEQPVLERECEVKIRTLAVETGGNTVSVHFGEESFISVDGKDKSIVVPLSAEQVEKLQIGLQAEKKGGSKEIERKFLVNLSQLPEGWDKNPNVIVQGYVALAENGTEIRVRQKGNKFYFTIKGDGTLIRSEVEIELTQEQFGQFIPFINDRTVEKVRYPMPYGYQASDGVKAQVIVEFDVYGGKLTGFPSTAEVEFNNKTGADQFVKPAFLGDDVTDRKDLKNKNLAIRSRESTLNLILSLSGKLDTSLLRVITNLEERKFTVSVRLKQPLTSEDAAVINNILKNQQDLTRPTFTGRDLSREDLSVLTSLSSVVFVQASKQLQPV